MIVRAVNVEDAAGLAQIMVDVESSSAYMLWVPGERNTDLDGMRKRIKAMKGEGNSSIFIAEENNRLIGYVMAMGGKAQRNKHSVYLVVGVLEAYRGMGIGTALLLELECWTRERGIHRLELTTVTRNTGGVALYQKMGFEIEGRKRDSLLIDGEYVDENYMSKLL